MVVDAVALDAEDPSAARLEAWILTMVEPDRWAVCGSLSGLQTVDGTLVACERADEFEGELLLASTGVPYTTARPAGAVSFTITARRNDVFLVGDRFVFTTTGYTPYSQPIRVLDGEVHPAMAATTPANGAIDPAQPSNPDGSKQFGWDVVRRSLAEG